MQVKNPFHLLRKGLDRIPRNIAFIGILAFIALYIPLSALYRSGIPQAEIKSIVEQEMTKAFRREIRIGQISGNLFSQIILEDITVAHLGKIEDGVLMNIDYLAANFSLWHAIRSGADPLGSVETITIDGAEMHIIRDKNDVWNILDFLLPPPLPPGAPLPPPLPFRGEIYLRNAHGSFSDEIGWAKDPLQQPFTEEFREGSGYLDFQDLEATIINISARFKNSGLPMSLNGHLNATNAQFKLNVTVPRLDTEHWASYVFPVQGFRLSDDSISLYGSLVSKTPFPKTGIPFTYSLNVAVQKLSIKMPYFTDPLTQVKGDLHLHNRGNSNTIEFKKYRGIINEIPVTGQGAIALHRQYIDLGLETSAFDATRLQDLFPSLKQWQYQGKSTATLQVKGDLNKPKISGQIRSPELRLYGLDPKDITLAYRYQNKDLALQIETARYHGAITTGNLSINFTTGIPSVNAQLHSQDIQLHSVFPNLRNQLSPTASLHIDLAGQWQNFTVTAQVTGPELRLYEQELQGIDIAMQVLAQRDITIHSIKAGIRNGGALSGSGQISDLTQLSLDLSTEQMQFRDPDPSQEQSPYGTVSLKASIQAPLTAAFFKAPQTQSRLKLQATLSKGQFYAQPLHQAKISLDYNRGDTTISELELIHKTGELRGRASIKGKALQTLNLYLNDWELHSSQLFHNQLSSRWTPFSGTATGRLAYSKNAALDLDLSLRDWNIKEHLLQRLDLKGSWDGTMLRIDSASLEQPRSNLKLKGRYAENNVDISILPGSQLHMNDFSKLLAPYGLSGGSGTIMARITGSIDSPNISLDFNVSDTRYHEFWIQNLSGTGRYQNKELTLAPITATINDGSIETRGLIDLAPILNARKKNKDKAAIRIAHKDLSYELIWRFNRANISELVELAERIHADIKTGKKKRKAPAQSGPLSLPIMQRIGLLEEQQNKRITLYSKDSRKPSVHTYIQSLTRRLEDSLDFKPIYSQKVSGLLNGSLQLRSNKKHSPGIQGQLSLDNAKIASLRAESILVATVPDSRWSNAKISLLNGSIAGSAFKKIHASTQVHPTGQLYLEQLHIETPSHHSKNLATGSIPIAAIWDKGSRSLPLDLSIQLKGNDIDALSLLSPAILSMKNQGQINARLTGPLHAPRLSAKDLSLKNAGIRFNPNAGPLNSQLNIPSANLSLRNNTLTILSLPMIWSGEDSRDRSRNNRIRKNQLALSGTVSARTVSLSPLALTLHSDLRLSDTSLSLYFPALYHGQLQSKDLRLSGSYNRAQSLYPLLSGQLTLSDGRIAVPKLGKSSKKSELRLDLSSKINSGVTVEGGILGTGVLSIANSLFLELEQTGPDQRIDINGTVKQPIITGKLRIREGAITLFDKVFDIIPPQKQRQFFREHPQDSGENSIAFITDQQKPNTLIPLINLRAITYVDQNSQSTDNASIAQYTGIVLIAKGPLDNLDKSLTIATYKTNSPYASYQNPELIQRVDLAQSQNQRRSQEALQLVLPELFENPEQSNFARFGSQQANIWFRRGVRPLERNLARRLGLYDIRVDYDLSRAFRANTQEIIQEENLLGVNLIWDLMQERLFMRVKADIDLAAENSQNLDNLRLTEWEMSYFITQHLSASIRNISEYRNDRDFKPRPAIKYSYEF